MPREKAIVTMQSRHPCMTSAAQLGKRCGTRTRVGVGQVIGFEQISDLPMSGLKEVTMAKKKKAKKKAKK
jgi:hypothetical protein